MYRHDIFGILFLAWLVIFGTIAIMALFKRSDGWRGVRWALIPIIINTTIWAFVLSNVWGLLFYASTVTLICGTIFYVPLFWILGKGLYLKYKVKERFSAFRKGYVGYSISFVLSSLAIVVLAQVAGYYAW